MNSEIYLRLENLMNRLGFSASDGSFTKAEMKAYAAAISRHQAAINQGKMLFLPYLIKLDFIPNPVLMILLTRLVQAHLIQ